MRLVLNSALKFLLDLDIISTFFHLLVYSISDSLRNVVFSVLIYETIINLRISEKTCETYIICSYKSRKFPRTFNCYMVIKHFYLNIRTKTSYFYGNFTVISTLLSQSPFHHFQYEPSLTHNNLSDH